MNFKPIFSAIAILTSAVVVGISVPTQAANPSLRVSIESDAWQSVPVDLNWSAGQIRDTQAVTRQLQRFINRRIDTLATRGAVEIRAVRVSPDTHKQELLSSLPDFKSETYLTVLEGLDKSGKRVGRTGPLPIGGQDISGYLIHLVKSPCSPTGAGAGSKCKLTTPKPRVFLRASLISQLYGLKTSSFDVVEKLQLLVDTKAQYVVKNGAIHSEEFATLGEASPVSLSDTKTGSTYQIKIGSSPYSINYIEKVDVRKIAKHLKMAKDELGLAYLTPFSEFWK